MDLQMVKADNFWNLRDYMGYNYNILLRLEFIEELLKSWLLIYLIYSSLPFKFQSEYEFE